MSATETNYQETTAELIRNVIENRQTDYNWNRINLTITIVVAQVISTDKDVDELVHIADEAMYKAKQAGRNRTVAAEKISPKVVQ